MMNPYWMSAIHNTEPTEAQELEALEALDTLTDNLSTVKAELNRKLILAQKYGMDEYADEIVILLEKLDYYRKH